MAAELLAVKFAGYRALTELQRGERPGREVGLAQMTMVRARHRGGRPRRRRPRPRGARRRRLAVAVISYLPGFELRRTVAYYLHPRQRTEYVANLAEAEADASEGRTRLLADVVAELDAVDKA